MNFNLSLLHSKLMKSICVMTAALLMWTQNLGIEISLRGCYDSLRSLVSYSFYEPTVKINQSGLIDKKADYTISSKLFRQDNQSKVNNKEAGLTDLFVYIHKKLGLSQ